VDKVTACVGQGVRVGDGCARTVRQVPLQITTDAREDVTDFVFLGIEFIRYALKDEAK
jgi:hypothetical protein